MAKVNIVEAARNNIYRRGLKTENKENKSGFSIDKSKPADDKDVIIVQKGQKYFWWQFPHSEKIISLDPPRREQLTRNGWQLAMYDFEDRLSEASNFTDPDDLKDHIESLISDMTELRDEQEEKKSNMPEGLQESSTGELLQERYDMLDDAINSLEGIDLDFSPIADDTKDEQTDEHNEEYIAELAEWIEEKHNEIEQISVG